MTQADPSSRRLTIQIFLRVAAAAVVVTLVIWGGLHAYTVHYQRQEERQQAETMARVIADNSLRDGIFADASSLQGMLNQLASMHRPLRHAVVYRQGTVFAEYRRGSGAERVVVPPLAETEDDQPELSLVRAGGGTAFYNVVLARGDLAVQVGIDRGPLEPDTVASIRRISVAGLLGLAIGLGLAWTIAAMTSAGVVAANRALRATEERYRTLFDSAPDSILLLEPQTDGVPIIRDANESTCRLHGYRREEIIGQPITFLDRESEKAGVPERTGRVLGRGIATFEVEHVAKDGRVIPLEVTARTVEMGGVTLIQSVERDISERRRAETERTALEAQLHQAQKMEAIGRLAGGIAHDMNNLLGAVMSSALLLEETLEPGLREQREHVANILATCRRGRDLTQNFLGYARQGRYRREPVDLNSLVDDTVAMLRSSIPKKIKVDTNLAVSLPTVHGDRNLIALALMNLGINAIDALGEEGTLTFTTETVELDPTVGRRTRELAPGPHVAVHVADDGCGMDEATLAQAMEPFFTTKPSGKGTGLGLSMAYGTLKSHGGDLVLTSAPGRGTTVSMLFPAATVASVAAAPPAERDIAPRQLPTGSAGILLVEDEQLLRRTGQQLLERLGYRVWVAGDGREALDRLAELGSEVSLVLLDLIMPTMDGRETFAELRVRRPDLKVLLMSGFSHDDDIERLIAAGAAGFIAKPFERETLAEAVAQAVGSGSLAPQLPSPGAG